MIDCSLVVDTHSNYSDLWKPYFRRLEQFGPDFKKIYVFTDNKDGLPEYCIPIIYSNEDSYRNQILSCLKQVQSEIILYNSEDYLLYKPVNIDMFNVLIRVLQTKGYDFIKLIRGPEEVLQFENFTYLFRILQSSDNLFAQQASLWKTQSFLKVFEASSPMNGRMEQEPGGSHICRSLNIKGLQYYHNTPKRGIVHYDSDVYPYIATAITKSKWNTREYPEELATVFNEFNIDPNVRGTNENR